MAGIYKRGKTWWGRCQRSGKDIRVSLETRSESVARKRLAAWTAELDASAWGEKPRMTLNEVADLFIREHIPTLRPSTARRYGASIEWLDQRLGSLLLNQITSAVLVEFETWRRSAGVSAPTIRRDLSTLSSIFTFAIEREWIDANPIGPFLRQRRRRGLREAPGRTRYLSRDEEGRLLAAATPAVRAAIIFAISSGLRQAEQFGLTWDRVDLTRSVAIIPAAEAKGKRDRTVIMLPAAVEVCRHTPRHIRSPYIFRHDDGSRYRHLNRGLAAAARRAGISDLRWHDLRRTHGCRLLQEYAWSMEMVRDQLGHSSVVTTERSYAFLEVETRHGNVYPAQKPAHGDAV